MTSTPEAAAVKAVLEAEYPHMNWDEVLSQSARTSPQQLADWLINERGFDEDTVKKLCFDS